MGNANYNSRLASVINIRVCIPWQHDNSTVVANRLLSTVATFYLNSYQLDRNQPSA